MSLAVFRYRRGVVSQNDRAFTSKQVDNSVACYAKQPSAHLLHRLHQTVSSNQFVEDFLKNVFGIARVRNAGAVDMETGAVVALTVQAADAGDTHTVQETLAQANENIEVVAEAIEGEPDAPAVAVASPAELVTDKGYHSRAVVRQLAEAGIRGYISEPERGRQRWDGQSAEQAAIYGNRRRMRSERGKRLQRQRGEKVERTMAHLYETGRMRRVHLRGHNNIIKRLLIHACHLGPTAREN